MPKRLLFIAIALAAALALHNREEAAAQVIDREYEIKAALLYQLGALFNWPVDGDAEKPFVIGILGEDPFGPHLAEVKRRKTIGGRSIEIVRFASIDDYQPCQMLFIPAASSSEGPTSQQRVAQALDKIKGDAVLIVGEVQGLPADGAALSIFVKENRMRLEINPDAVQRAGLKVPPQVLRLATPVRDR